MRALEGFETNVVISWLNPLTWDSSPKPLALEPMPIISPILVKGGTKEMRRCHNLVGVVMSLGCGSTTKTSWISPTASSAPVGQHAVLANALQNWGVITSGVTAQTWTRLR